MGGITLGCWYSRVMVYTLQQASTNARMRQWRVYLSVAGSRQRRRRGGCAGWASVACVSVSATARCAARVHVQFVAAVGGSTSRACGTNRFCVKTIVSQPLLRVRYKRTLKTSQRAPSCMGAWSFSPRRATLLPTTPVLHQSACTTLNRIASSTLCSRSPAPAGQD